MNPRTILTIILALAPIFACVVPRDVKAAEPLDIGSKRELFVDDYLIDKLEGGVRLVLEKPRNEGVVFKYDDDSGALTGQTTDTGQIWTDIPERISLDIGTQFGQAGNGAGNANSGRGSLQVGQNGGKRMDIKVDGDFPGGNIIVAGMAGDMIRLSPDMRDTEGKWFYWYFRVRGAEGRRLTFSGLPLGRLGPAVSADGGKTWAWHLAKPLERTPQTFTYSFDKGAGDIRFCVSLPYVESDLRAFLKRHADSKHLVVETHATSRKGRKIRRLRLGKLSGEPTYRVLLTSRHHACETVGSWVLEGIMDAVLADTSDGRWFRDNVEMVTVPFMDKDGVEDGDQGNHRKPYDHNRDYHGKSLYPSVKALKNFVPTWSRGPLAFAMDLHCPLLSDHRVYMYLQPEPDMLARQRRFSRILKRVQTGPLVYKDKGHADSKARWYQSTCRGWLSVSGLASLCFTIEVPYSLAGEAPVTAASTRALGYDLARAIRQYLQQDAGAVDSSGDGAKARSR